MSRFPDISRPGEGLVVPDGDTRATLTFVDDDGVIQSRALGLGPEIRAALAGAAWVAVEVLELGTAMRLPTGVILPVPPGATP